MKVIPIRSKMLFKDFGPRAGGGASEGARFFAKAALNFWGPTMLFCYLISAPLPLYMMLCSHAVGVLMGLLIYSQQPYGVLSCVPVDYRPDVPNVSHTGEIEKAA
jgi:hypothetical protein